MFEKFMHSCINAGIQINVKVKIQVSYHRGINKRGRRWSYFISLNELALHIYQQFNS